MAELASRTVTTVQNGPDLSESAAPRHNWQVLVLAVIVFIALFCRLYRLLPIEVGLLYAQDADEGVYATTAQLALQGFLPYRDFFTPMPPLAVYMSGVVLRLLYHPWGSSIGLMALRLASVAYGLLTVVVAYHTARTIGGRRAGLLAAALLAVDGIVIAQDRRAMLEAPSNLFSVLAVFSYVKLMGMGIGSARERPETAKRFTLGVVITGLLSACALLTKGTSIATVVAVGLDLAVRRKWRAFGRYGATLVTGYLMLALPFLVACPAEFIKQNYVFHFLRPYGGTAHPLARLAEIWNYAWSWSTVRFGLAGSVLMLVAGHRIRKLEMWRVICLWAGLVLALLLSSRTYWATYFSQLAVPLSILGGLLLTSEVDYGAWNGLKGHRPPSQQALRLLPVLLLTGILVLGFPSLKRQFEATRGALEQTKPAYVAVSEAVLAQLPGEAPILAFETNYTFLSSHPPASKADGSFFVDSYGQMLYVNLGIPELSLGGCLRTWLEQEHTGSRTIFCREPAQAEVREIFDLARYMVFDGRAANQLTDATSKYILQHSDLLYSSGGTELRERSAGG